jgi:hypothetical protein
MSGPPWSCRKREHFDKAAENLLNASVSIPELPEAALLVTGERPATPAPADAGLALEDAESTGGITHRTVATPQAPSGPAQPAAGSGVAEGLPSIAAGRAGGRGDGAAAADMHKARRREGHLPALSIAAVGHAAVQVWLLSQESLSCCQAWLHVMINFITFTLAKCKRLVTEISAALFPDLAYLDVLGGLPLDHVPQHLPLCFPGLGR